MVLSSDGAVVSGDRTIVIQSPGFNVDDPDIMVIHGAKVDLQPVSNGDVLTYDSGTNQWTGQAPTTSGRTEIIKPTDETASLDSTLSNDSDLQFTMAANTVYNIEVEVFFETNATADFKYALTGPASPTRVDIVERYFAAGSSSEVTAVGVAYPSGTAITGSGSTGGYIKLNMTVNNGVNSGTFALQWCQNTSNPGTTKVIAGSKLTYNIP
jgi:hypothetical protein